MGNPLSRRKLLGIAAGGAAGAALPAPAWAIGDQRPGAVRPPVLTADDRSVAGQVSARRGLEHLRVLSERIGPRVSGTPAENRAADWIAGVLDSLGYDTTTQPFAAEDIALGSLGAPGGLPADLGWQVGATESGALDTTVRGAVVDAGTGAPEGYPDDVTGRIVLIDFPWVEDPDVLAGTAVARGAAAIVFVSNDHLDHSLAPAFPPWLANPVPIPVVGAGQPQKHRLRALLAAGALPELTVSTRMHRGLTSYNVLAERAHGTGDGPVVMVSAHYDTVIGSPGANDDGSGTVLTLELARVLRHLPVNATLRFALWGSEESGLVGSRHYVAGLPQRERDRIVAVFQNDMVATSWDPAIRYWLLSLAGEPNRSTDEVVAAASRLGYTPHLSAVTERGASDHASFQEVGIAAANFSWRGEDDGWIVLEPPYHSPEDTITHNISLERLQVSMELIASAAYATARNP
ncbi:M28 family metallopeptidase [Catenuloplanes niger JCM 9533]